MVIEELGAEPPKPIIAIKNCDKTVIKLIELLIIVYEKQIGQVDDGDISPIGTFIFKKSLKWADC